MKLGPSPLQPKRVCQWKYFVHEGVQMEYFRTWAVQVENLRSWGSNGKCLLINSCPGVMRGGYKWTKKFTPPPTSAHGGCKWNYQNVCHFLDPPMFNLTQIPLLKFKCNAARGKIQSHIKVSKIRVTALSESTNLY